MLKKIEKLCDKIEKFEIQKSKIDDKIYKINLQILELIEKKSDEYKVKYKKNKAKEWYANIIHKNGNIIVTTEGYKNKKDCESAMINLANNLQFIKLK